MLWLNLFRKISDERKSAAFTESDLSQLHLDIPIHSPLGLAIIDGDLLAVSDLETNTVYQIASINTGASLRGTVTEIVKLAQGTEPYGLAYSKNHLYIGDSSPNGGVLKVSLESCEVTVVVRNGTVDCNTVHAIAVNNDGKIEVTVIAGCESDGSNDGSSSCASLSQPTALCVEGNTLYVADTSVGAIRMVTPCEKMCKFLKELNALYQVFGVHLKKKKAEWYSLEEAIPPLERLYDFCISWIKDVQQCMGKECVTQGPEGTVSRKSVQSLELMISSLKRVQEVINKVNPSYRTQINLSSFLTLMVEHFFSKMRSRNETPTVLEFAQLLRPTIIEALKQRTACGFYYYTADASYYTQSPMICRSLLPICPPYPNRRPSACLAMIKRLFGTGEMLLANQYARSL